MNNICGFFFQHQNGFPHFLVPQLTVQGITQKPLENNM